MNNEKVYLIVEQKPETKVGKAARNINDALIIGSVVVAVAPLVCGLVYNGVEWVKYKHKIKKGLKDGSIIEIDGQYYEVDQKSSD